MYLTIVDDDGAIQIPDTLREATGLHRLTLVSVEQVGDALVLRPASVTATEGWEFFQRLGQQRPLTPGEERRAVEWAVGAEWAREEAEGRHG